METIYLVTIDWALDGDTGSEQYAYKKLEDAVKRAEQEFQKDKKDVFVSFPNTKEYKSEKYLTWSLYTEDNWRENHTEISIQEIEVL